MISVARDAVRSVDAAIDFGTAGVRVATGSQHVRERRAVSGAQSALAGGVIVDRLAAVEVLRPMLHRARHWAGFPRLRALACVPSDASVEERAALSDCITHAGASAVHIAMEPLAAAIGAGLDVGSPYARFLMDIGEGVTDCAVIRSAQVIRSQAVRVGCANLRVAIQQCVSENHDVILGDDEAERLLRSAGVGAGAESATLQCLRNNTMCALTILAAELRAALAPQLASILGNLEELLRDLPAPLSAEIIEEGIYLSGGGALLRGMPDQVVRVSQMDVHVVGDPLGAVIRGIRAMLPIAATMRLWRNQPAP